ncbi:uncharacterized protein LODBEIA_P58470 [Lodderomyces beijingensis]|uniref:Major facilitator superfamily (MFS) profile domain-containing protein n=1 Tax=Lodderomyces beijingensis TaxID=1775926 RepID=A0ABP0ZU09_9ASCO
MPPSDDPEALVESPRKARNAADSTESYSSTLGEPKAFPLTDADGNFEEPEIADYEPVGVEANSQSSRVATGSQLSRELSRRITNTQSLLTRAQSSTDPMPSMGGGKEFPPMLPDRDPYCVEYEENDPNHPHNWWIWKKVLYCVCVGVSALSCSVGSAMFSASNQAIMEKFHIGTTVAALGTSLVVFGFAAGPVIYGPMSELFGRKIVLVISTLGYVCFMFGAATGKDIQTIMICRFFAGFVGSAPLVVAPASMVDMFNARARGTAIAIFASVLFGGPMLAPILGGFTVKNSALGWRYTSYFSAYIGVIAFLLNTFVLQETHHPVILVRKAELLRRRTGNWGIFAPHEEVSLDLKEIAVNNVARPIKLLFTEPIIFLVSIYNAFIYGMLYMFLTAVPMIFLRRYHWRQGVAELPYISMLLGVFSGGVMISLYEVHVHRLQDTKGRQPVPEDRLPPIMVGAFTFVIGIFWMGWTGDYAEHVHWIVPTIGAFFIGNGLMAIFLPTLNYIIDCYVFVAASALAGNTFLRSGFGAAFPLFATQMFTNLTIKWASTLVGCLGVLMIPVPFLFYKYGGRIRQRSKYALKT